MWVGGWAGGWAGGSMVVCAYMCLGVGHVFLMCECVCFSTECCGCCGGGGSGGGDGRGGGVAGGETAGNDVRVCECVHLCSGLCPCGVCVCLAVFVCLFGTSPGPSSANATAAQNAAAVGVGMGGAAGLQGARLPGMMPVCVFLCVCVVCVFGFVSLACLCLSLCLCFACLFVRLGLPPALVAPMLRLHRTRLLWGGAGRGRGFAGGETAGNDAGVCSCVCG